MNRNWQLVFNTCGWLIALLALGPVDRALGIVPGADLRTVALSGAPAPGAGTGVTYKSLYDADDGGTPTPVVNKFGQVAFTPLLSSFVVQGGVERYDHAVYSEGSGTLSLIAKQRTQPPGTASNIRYLGLGDLTLNDSGAVAYWASLSGSTSSDYAIFSNRSGANSLIARTNQQAIGYPSGVTYGYFFGPDFTNSGKIAFSIYPNLGSSSLNPPGAVYSDVGSSNFQLVARTGDPAPGIPGSNYGPLGLPTYLNSAGDLAFAFQVDDTDTYAFWTKKPTGPVTLLIRGGDPAPGLPGLTCPSYGVYSFGGADSIVLGGQLSGPGVASNNDDAMFYPVNGNLTLLAREGQQAFGLPAGVVFGRVTPNGAPIDTFVAAKTNSRGDVLFRGELRGNGVIDHSNDSGLWVGNAASGFHLVARRGTSIGASLGSTTGVIKDTALNEIGQLAFLADYSSSPGFYTAIMGTDLSGNLVEIARTGQQIDVDNGPGIDLRTISTFFQYDDGYNQDNDLIRISPLGHVLFRAQFTDGSNAILLSYAVAVPEPDTAALIAIALLGLKRRPRHRTR